MHCTGCSMLHTWIPFSPRLLQSSISRLNPSFLYYSTLPATRPPPELAPDTASESPTTPSPSVDKSAFSVAPSSPDDDLIPGWHSPEAYALLREIANKTTLPSPRLFGSYGVGKPLVGELAPIRPREHRWEPQPMTMWGKEFTEVIARNRPSTNYIVAHSRERDLTMRGVSMWLKERSLAKRRQQQSYDVQLSQDMGAELACAHVFLSRGARVRFEGVDRWYGKKEDNMNAVPKRFLDTIRVEAIDATGTDILYEAFENIVGLRYLRSLTLRNCKDVDDWCLPRLYILSNTLEYLDLSGCPKISERGLACLYHLRNLKTLVLENMENVENKELYALLLEDELPLCEMIGVAYNQAQLPAPTPLQMRLSDEEEWQRLNVPVYDTTARPDTVEVGNPVYSHSLVKEQMEQQAVQEKQLKELQKKYGI